MDWRERISIDSRVLLGKPVIRGTRLSVEFVVGLFAQGWTVEEVLANYPGLTDDDLRACFGYANEVLQSERIYPLGA